VDSNKIVEDGSKVLDTLSGSYKDGIF
jgi:hypothetical protein